MSDRSDRSNKGIEKNLGKTGAVSKFSGSVYVPVFAAPGKT